MCLQHLRLVPKQTLGPLPSPLPVSLITGPQPPRAEPSARQFLSLSTCSSWTCLVASVPITWFKLLAARQPQPSPQDGVFPGAANPSSPLPSGFPSHLPRNPLSLHCPKAPDCPLLPVLPSPSLRRPVPPPPDIWHGVAPSLPLSACPKCHVIGRLPLTPTVKDSSPGPLCPLTLRHLPEWRFSV